MYSQDSAPHAKVYGSFTNRNSGYHTCTPFISHENLLVGKEGVNTSQNFNESFIKNISDVIRDQFNAKNENLSAHLHVASCMRTEHFDTIKDINMDSPACMQGCMQGQRCTGTCEIENRGNPTSPEHCEIGEIDEDPSKILSLLRNKNLSRPIIGHININFLNSKFEALNSHIKDTLDILVVTETKVVQN